jgi:hypothetical protein
MPKSSFFTGQPILNQLLSLVPRALISQLAQKHKADRYCKRFKAYDHLVSMLFCGFHHCSSLRELITGLQVNSHRLSHLGLLNTPRRSTLADANKRRPAVFFEDLFHALYKLHYGHLPDSRIKGNLDEKLFIIDSTTITLFCDVLKGAGTYGLNGKKKGGLKAHVLTRAKDQVPCFVHLGASAQSDRIFMPMLELPKGSVICMDKAYVNYKVMRSWTENHITWVTRYTHTLKYQIIEEKVITGYQEKRGVRSDAVILLGNPKTKYLNPLQKARLVKYYDNSGEREFIFLSNNLQYSPLTIAEIYKQRWDIETLFKRVKQNFQLHNFLGDNENAIKIQMWCTLIADLLVSIVKDRVDKLRKRKWAFANIAGLIRQHLTTYIDLIKFLINPEKAIINYSKEVNEYQLTLFKT